MFTLTITEKGGTSSVREFDQEEISIGRVQDNDVVLPKSNISKRHARIINNNGQFVVIDSKSTNGTYINGKRIDAPYDLKEGDKIFVGDFTLEVVNGVGGSAEKAAPPPPPQEEDRRATDSAIDDGLLGDDAAWGDEGGADEDWGDDWGDGESEGDGGGGDFALDDPVPAEPMVAEARGEPEAPLAGDDDQAMGVDDELAALEAELAKPKRKTTAKPATRPTATLTGAAPREPTPAPAERSVARRKASPGPTGPIAAASRMVHDRLLRALDLRRLDVEQMDDDALRAKTQEAVEEIIAAMEQEGELPNGVGPAELLATVLDEALGLGPLEDLLSDDSVTEIMVNGPTQVFVERSGKIQPADRTFSSDQAVMSVIERIVAPIGRRIDESSPMVDARLKDGSRVNAIIPPLALNGPVLTIRKFTREPLSVDDLVMGGTLTADMATFLETCVRARKNIIISGGTGSGKTTTLNVLSSFIPDTDRIITIEDAAELKLEQEHVVSLESRPPNIEGRGAITIRDLVRNALRMRPDRIVVGECRGGEALDMLQAMNTGHDGSLTTVHANGPRDALARLETMVMMSGMELPMRAIREQVNSAIDIIVQQTRFPDGTRKITHITEVTGMEGDVISLQDIFLFEQEGFDGETVTGAHKASGAIPRFYESLRAMGLEADLEIFQ